MIYVPPEWAPHKATWTAWPSHPGLWREHLASARQELARMIGYLARGETVRLLAMGDEAIASARTALAGLNAEVIPARFGDIWLRDTAPVFARRDGRPIALAFRFNGWGGKFELPHDDDVSALVAARSGARPVRHDFVLEGGSVEFDGAGRLLTTRECLLNSNRNPQLSRAAVENRLRMAFGVEKIIWLDRGVVNDHTDGHIDNIARFIAPAKAVCQSPSGADDPNAELFDAVARELQAHGIEVMRIPSPGLITGEDGAPLAASHMNYVIGNECVVIPAYETRYIEQAVAALGPLFPGRDIVASPARSLLTGGGSFHCITQQEPL